MLIRNDSLHSDIHLDFVPMVDVLFNLLIFFLLATTIAQVEREMNIALPFSQSSVPISAALREMVVNVDEQGAITVGGRALSREQFGAMVKEAVGANPEQKVSLRGDRRAAYGTIVAVLDICKANGLQEPYLDTVIGE